MVKLIKLAFASGLISVAAIEGCLLGGCTGKVTATVSMQANWGADDLVSVIVDVKDKDKEPE
jgi:hypothetical protein